MSEVFLTGCDKNTEWQLPWFIENYEKHCKLPLIIADFGMSEDMLTSISSFTIFSTERAGWFSKIEALLRTSRAYDKVCWLDTDCQVIGDPSGIFRYTENNKLTMVVDHPWTTRRPQQGEWYNSGVVAVEGTPIVLPHWLDQAREGNYRGDQEALHDYIGGCPIKRISTVAVAPHKYNVLRLDVVDNNVPDGGVIMHWTGEKGNLEIQKQMGL
jgi:hypothetical protein